MSAGQTVTVSYTPGDNPIAAVFTDQPVTDNTPAPDDPPGADDPAADDPASDGTAIADFATTLTTTQRN